MSDFSELSKSLNKAFQEDMSITVGKHADAYGFCRNLSSKIFKLSPNELRFHYGLAYHDKNEDVVFEYTKTLLPMRPFSRMKILDWLLKMPEQKPKGKKEKANKKLETVKAEGMLRFMTLARKSMKYGSTALSASSIVSELQNDFVTRSEVSKFKDKNFYSSREWKELRLAVLSASPICALCGADNTSAPLHIDHIKPRSLWPELSLEPSNMQVLCGPCNMAKSNIVVAQY